MVRIFLYRGALQMLSATSQTVLRCFRKVLRAFVKPCPFNSLRLLQVRVQPLLPCTIDVCRSEFRERLAVVGYVLSHGFCGPLVKIKVLFQFFIFFGWFSTIPDDETFWNMFLWLYAVAGWIVPIPLFNVFQL